MSSLLSPQIDFVFKNIFGVEGKEPLLISFLNSLFKGNPVVKNLTLGNTDICKTRHDGKSNRLDVHRVPITNKLKLFVMQDLDEGKNSTCFYGQVSEPPSTTELSWT